MGDSTSESGWNTNWQSALRAPAATGLADAPQPMPAGSEPARRAPFTGLAGLLLCALLLGGGIMSFFAVRNAPLDLFQEAIDADPVNRRNFEQAGLTVQDFRAICAGMLGTCGAVPALPLAVLLPFVFTHRRGPTLAAVIIAIASLATSLVAGLMCLSSLQTFNSPALVAVLIWGVVLAASLLFIVLGLVLVTRQRPATVDPDLAQQQAAWQAYYAQYAQYVQQVQRQQDEATQRPSSDA